MVEKKNQKGKLRIGETGEIGTIGSPHNTPGRIIFIAFSFDGFIFFFLCCVGVLCFFGGSSSIYLFFFILCCLNSSDLALSFSFSFFSASNGSFNYECSLGVLGFS